MTIKLSWDIIFFLFYRTLFIHVYKRKIKFNELFCFQREEPDVMFADNKACGGIEMSYTNNKKVNDF